MQRQLIRPRMKGEGLMGKKTPKDSAYIYSSTEVSRFYGITVKGMEFYEKKGLVHPQRIGQGNYRRFTLDDSYRLYLTRLLKNSGIGLPQTLDMLSADSLEHIEHKFSAELDKMKEVLELQQMRLDALLHMREMMCLSMNEEPFFEIVECDGFHRLFLRHFNGPHESNDRETREYQHWNDFLPITAASLRFPLDECRIGAVSVDTQVGLIVEEKRFRVLGLSESSRTQYIPGGRFLHTIIRGDAQQMNDAAWLQPALHLMQREGLRQTADAFTRFIFIVEEQLGCMRYDEAWFPIA